ncbi:MAG: GH3 auxin-responsive promoter family protein [Anaerolineaceae bacterium]|nr:GH3 auxin-responsive promoter family protein [Anaerolineaceae bacterium]
MTYTSEMIKRGEKEKIWEKYCGYLELSMEEYMQIQERLLIEQFETLKDCHLGKHFFGKQPPKTIKEFRKKVPLTTYADYVDFLKDKKEDDLPKANYRWARTSGKSGRYACKWIPITDGMYEKIGETFLTGMILASCSEKEDVQVKPDDIFLLAMAPPPYISSYMCSAIEDLIDVKFIPSLAEGEKMEFGERLAAGFSKGMETGIDYFTGLASILVKMGELIESGKTGSNFSLKMLKPKILGRYFKAFVKAKLQKRNILPKDIWNLKGIGAGGMDTDIYKDKVEYYWGKMPLEIVGTTEGGLLSMQAWNYKGMTFLPDNNFYEFIPFNEHQKAKEDPSYTPKTLLMDELSPGIYEIVFTNFHGGVLLRYRIGDFFEVIAMEDSEIGCKLPQFRFFSRCDDYLDLRNMVRFTEKTIWNALEESGIQYVDWAVRKEAVEGKTILRLYLELDEAEKSRINTLEKKIKKALKKANPEFGDIEKIMGGDYLSITKLPSGAFSHYIQSQRDAGADLAHIKPPHMQPKDQQLEKLMNLE